MLSLSLDPALVARFRQLRANCEERVDMHARTHARAHTRTHARTHAQIRTAAKGGKIRDKEAAASRLSVLRPLLCSIMSEIMPKWEQAARFITGVVSRLVLPSFCVSVFGVRERHDRPWRAIAIDDASIRETWRKSKFFPVQVSIVAAAASPCFSAPCLFGDEDCNMKDRDRVAG